MIKFHDMASFSPSEIYDATQCGDVEDGEIIRLPGGAKAILVGAWPVLVCGECEGFHALKDGYSFDTLEGGRYAQAAKQAMADSEILDSLAHQAVTLDFEHADDQVYFDSARIEGIRNRLRILIERAIIRRAVTDILAVQPDDGPAYSIGVYDGEGVALKACRDLDAIMGAVMSTDEEALLVRRLHSDRASTYIGVIELVYGNDGYDVIADNSNGVEPLLEGATALANAIEEQSA